MMVIFKNTFIVTTVLMVVFIFSGIYKDISREELEIKYATGASQFLNLSDGTRIHYRDEGESDLPVILFLHGFNGSLFNFEKLIPLLKEEFRLVSLDLPGFGLTGAIPSNDYSNESFMKTVNSVVDHLKISKFSIAGNSMGGGVAWRYALSYPNKIESIILLSSSGIYSKEQRKSLEKSNRDTPWAWKLMRSKVVNYFLSYYTPKFFATQGLRTSVFDENLATKELAYQFHELTLLEGSRKAILSMFSKRRGDNHNADTLRSIASPLLAIHGEEDNIIPYSSSFIFEDNIKDVELKIYPNVGHLPMYEAPEKVAEDIKQFYFERF